MEPQVTILDNGSVLIDGEPLEALQTPRPGEPPASPGFADRMLAAGHTAYLLHQLREEVTATHGVDPSPLPAYIRRLVERRAMNWNEVIAPVGPPTPDTPLSRHTAPDWSRAAVMLGLRPEAIQYQMRSAYAEQQGHTLSPVAPLARRARAAGPTDSLLAFDEELRRAECTYTTDEIAELREIEAAVEHQVRAWKE